MFFHFPIDKSHPVWYTWSIEEIKGFLTATAPFFSGMEMR